jgi:pilus assembly protein TadC
VTAALLLGAAWAVVVAIPVVGQARRAGAGARAVALRPPGARARRRWLRARPAPPPDRVGGAGGDPVARIGTPIRFVLARSGGMVGRVIGGLRARVSRRRIEAAVQRELPVVLDLLGVAVGAGCTPYLAIEATQRWAPPDLAARFERVLRACRLGAAFPDALDELGRTTPQLQPVVDALLASDRLGAPVGPALARLAEEERATSRRRAEAHARRVPVRLLFPLVFLVLPAFGLLTVVPALLSGLARA